MHALLISCATLFFACSISAGAATHADTLVVGMDLSYPPFEMTDKAGEPSGLSVELAQELGKALNKPIAIQNMAFDGLIPALKTGKIDLILSSMTATAERARSIDFSEPYFKSGLSLLVNKSSPVASVADLDNPQRTIAVKRGTTGHIYVAQHLKKAHLLLLDKESSAVMEVVQAKADATIYDQIFVVQNWQRNPDTTRVLLDPIDAGEWAIGIRKGNDALKVQVNAFLATFRANGGFSRLADAYLQEQKAGFEKLGVPFPL
ncbi:transporter substrate-binding domain-containing protein [Candidatus Methylospira mobilis]|uniref:Transporter substrate-binding domain-containing protein n=1 Tax=Candidatus Methylospira mobilis TaxID=1808979 RepID=A0A5Q0BCJ0_9GAMM|nr:transporter substrate-binding domain-containing protein [Candidatus Methylospira mobilis]QFY41643.1 transporter substrate-binding domain-containing protein [Candidatus Methylospira mobilis]